MKIRCEKCQAKYSIGEGLLKKKITKFRCKKCGHVMSVRKIDAEDSEFELAPKLGYEPAQSEELQDGATRVTQSPLFQESQEQWAHKDLSTDSHSSAEPWAETTDAASEAWSEYSASEQNSPGDQEIDDEFEQAFQEQEEEAKRRLHIHNEPTIAPNYQEQRLAAIGQTGDANRSVALQELQEKNTNVFSINALQQLRDERKAASEERKRKSRSRRGGAQRPGQASTQDLNQAGSSKAPPPPPIAIEEKKWYVLLGEEQVGPWTFSKVRSELRKGELSGDTLIWKEELDGWKPISELPMFLPALVQSSPHNIPHSQLHPSTHRLEANQAGGTSEGLATSISFKPKEETPPHLINDLQALAGTPPSTAITSKAHSSAHSILGDLGQGEVVYPPGNHPSGHPTAGAFSFGTGVSNDSRGNVFGAQSPFAAEKKSSSKGKWALLIALTVIVSTGGTVGILAALGLFSNKTQFAGPPGKSLEMQAAHSKGRLITPLPKSKSKKQKAIPKELSKPVKKVDSARRTVIARAEKKKKVFRKSSFVARNKKKRYKKKILRGKKVKIKRSQKKKLSEDILPPPPDPIGKDKTKKELDEPPLPPPPVESVAKPRKRESTRRLPTSLSRNQVASVMRRGFRKIKQCQENYGSDLSKIVVSWTIQKSGRPSGIKVELSSKRLLSSCIKKRIRSWRFPKFSGKPMDIRVPFAF